MRLTQFFQLKECVRQLDGNEGIDGLAFRLKEEPFRVDPAELVYGKAGIYLITSDGAVCRVMLYDAEQTVDSTGMDPILRQDLLSGGFDNNKLVATLPRYHFLNCETIQQYKNSQWQDDKAWQISQRPSARFIFRYVTRSGVLCDMDTQRLMPCEHCVSEMKELGAIKNAPDKSPIHRLSENAFHTRSHLPAPSECASVPKNLWADWSLISQHHRKKTGTICQGKSCKVTKHTKEKLQDSLETHYKPGDQTPQHFHLIESLCALCHSHREGHQYMQRRANVLELNKAVNLTGP